MAGAPRREPLRRSGLPAVPPADGFLADVIPPEVWHVMLVANGRLAVLPGVVLPGLSPELANRLVSPR